MGEPQSLRTWRELRGLTQAQLAEKVGVSQGMIAWIETGRSAPNITLAYDIADALGVPDRDIAWPQSERERRRKDKTTE